MTDKMRAEFEAWRLRNFCGGAERLKKCSNAPEIYYYTAEQEAWKVWQASRAALVVELPEKISQYNTDDDGFVNPAAAEHDEAIDDCRAAIEAAGVRVKP